MPENRIPPGARPRLVALDLDGTLLRSDGSLSARTLAALGAVRRAELTLVIVTARPPRRMRDIALKTGLSGLAICSNGAVVYDLDQHCIVQQTTIAADRARELVVRLRNALPDVAFAIEAGSRYGCEPSYVIQTEHPHDAADPAMLREDALALCLLGVTKLIVQHRESTLAQLLRVAREHADELTVTHSGSEFVEIAPAGVTKAVALAALCARLGVAAAQVVAFGDMPNDLPMLSWAGRGVAVANAHPEVLSVAREVTASNDADGVALVLERVVTENA